MAGFLAAPAVAFAVMVWRPKTILRWKIILACVAAVLFGMTPFATQLIRAAHFPAIAEGEPTACSTEITAKCTFDKVGIVGMKRRLDLHGHVETPLNEQQLTRFAGRTSGATMRANQLRLYCSSVDYLLLHLLRRLALAGTAMARAQGQTLRLRLPTIGARVRVTTRKVWLALASGCPDAALFTHAHAVLTHRRA